MPNEVLVRRVLGAIGGDVPMADAVRLLAPGVVMHMDRFTTQGVDVWLDWVEFLRSRGVENVRVEVDRVETGADGLVTAIGRVMAGAGAKAAPREGRARYRVVDGRIAEIWTSRENYEIVFGAKVRHPLRWLFVLAWMAMWRRLPWRRRTLVSPTRGGPGDGDGSRSKSRRGVPADDHPHR